MKMDMELMESSSLSTVLLTSSELPEEVLDIKVLERALVSSSTAGITVILLISMEITLESTSMETFSPPNQLLMLHDSTTEVLTMLGSISMVPARLSRFDALRPTLDLPMPSCQETSTSSASFNLPSPTLDSLLEQEVLKNNTTSMHGLSLHLMPPSKFLATPLLPQLLSVEME